MVSQPLAGIRVLELGVALAVPSAAAMLGDWGAEVIKVEPHTGDPQRGNTANAYFSQDNRAKRSIALDLATDEGKTVMLTLVDRADVFVTNVRPGGLQRLGLDPTSLLERNPRLIYGLLTGYGAEGPATGRAGYDIGAFWSRSGVAGALVGTAEPPVQRPAMGDHTTGLALVAAITTALFDRERTGTGRVVQTSLVRAGAYVVSSDLAAHTNGEAPEAGLRRALYNPMLACYRAGDGRWFFLLGLEATSPLAQCRSSRRPGGSAGRRALQRLPRPHQPPRGPHRHSRYGVCQTAARRMGRHLRHARRVVGPGPELRRGRS